MKSLLSAAYLSLALQCTVATAASLDIQGPPGSVKFGQGAIGLPNGNLLVFDPGFASDRGAVHLYSSAGELLGTASGESAHVLPGGNFVVGDPYDDSGRGAVYLYSGAGQLISTLRGSTQSDLIGFDVRVLPSGNVLAISTNWDNGGARDAGAVTWIDGQIGLNGVVTPQNSLTGSSSFDSVGSYVNVLGNGNYVVRSPLWDRTGAGTVTDAGAVTWARGDAGISGVVSASNSMVGSSGDDRLGRRAAVEVAGSNFVIACKECDSPNRPDAGAVRWVDGQVGAVGELNAGNSLVGASAEDLIGTSLFRLTDGSFYVSSESWHEGIQPVGALTWCPGTAPCVGDLSLANSLVGTTGFDFNALSGVALPGGALLVLAPNWTEPTQSLFQAGAAWVMTGATSARGHLEPALTLHGANAQDHVGYSARVLDDGNAVVISPFVRSGSATVGATTWFDAGAPVTGAVNTGNSLFGAADGDGTNLDVVALTEGRYVVACPSCDVAGVADSGAVLWSPAGGARGEMTADRVLRGYTNGDRIGSRVVALINGNYVVSSPSFSRSVLFPHVGAVTWVNGTNGRSYGESTPGAPVSAANSLVGSRSNDHVGNVVALSNGNYVVASPDWANGAVARAGAVTWADGTIGLSGYVSTSNSVVGSSIDDQIGQSVLALAGGNVVVSSPYWDDASAGGGTVFDSGAVTWIDGSRGLVGSIGADNSLISNRQLAANVGIIAELPGGRYVVRTPKANNCSSAGCVLSAGAITVGRADRPLHGRLDTHNSLLGTVMSEGPEMNYAPDPAHGRLLVGRPVANMVSLIEFSLFDDGFDP